MIGFDGGCVVITARLLERRDELDAFVGLLEAVDAGTGSVAVIEGPAGIGKSSLLAAYAHQAAERGMSVLRVLGDELVMESSFAAVRELFWAEAHSAEAERFSGAARLAAPVFESGAGVGTGRDRTSSVLHGLYWLTADLAARAPLAILIDDAQWLDPASARFVVYLARRIESLRAVLAVALRPGEGSDADRIRTELIPHATRVLHPRPLSPDGSAELIRTVLGPRADETLCQSCHEATRGNPFYLRELAATLKAEGGRPTVALARRVRALGAGAIAGSVLLRLVRLGPDAGGLAQTIAVLGPGCSLRHAATLASLDRPRATAAADALHAAELVSPGSSLAFVHPIVHEAISSQLPPAQRASLHADAARLLTVDGASADRVTAHLLLSEPYGEAWVVETLRSAAGEALARGAPEASVACLRRALAEPPAQETRLDVLFALGRAEALLPPVNDFASLRQALALAPDSRQRAEIAFELALALFGVLRNREAYAVVDDALQSADALDSELVDRLEPLAIVGGMDDPATAQAAISRATRQLERARQGEVTDPRMLATLAVAGADLGCSAGDAAVLARGALSDDRLLYQWLDDGYVTACAALCATDQLSEAARAVDRGLLEASRRGSAPMFVQLAWLRAELAVRAGDLDIAEDHAERALETARELGAEAPGRMALAVVLVERARSQEALALVDAADLSDIGTNDAVLLAERGIVRIAAGRLDHGLADLLTAGRRTAKAQTDLSMEISWVPVAAAALAARGRGPEARDLASRELDQATRFGAPRRLGLALSTCGSLDRGAEGLQWLREAVAVLERSEARLGHAYALVALGTGLLARGEKAAARASLAQGSDLAHRCGATALVDRAHAELHAAGARPRRAALTGPDALTPAERRTARMAADGLANREIAQALFVSTKTVEAQLSRAYEKLGINRRSELDDALGSAVPSGRGQRLTSRPASHSAPISPGSPGRCQG